jgi:hypothetical protein
MNVNEGRSEQSARGSVRVDFSDLSDYEARVDKASGINRWPLFFQDRVWLDAEGQFHLIDEMSLSYLTNLYNFVEKRIRSLPFPLMHGEQAQMDAEKIWERTQDEYVNWPLMRRIRQRITELESEGQTLPTSHGFSIVLDSFTHQATGESYITLEAKVTTAVESDESLGWHLAEAMLEYMNKHLKDVDPSRIRRIVEHGRLADSFPEDW